VLSDRICGAFRAWLIEHYAERIEGERSYDEIRKVSSPLSDQYIISHMKFAHSFPPKFILDTVFFCLFLLTVTVSINLPNPRNVEFLFKFVLFRAKLRKVKM